jgi:hypothetical protein
MARRDLADGELDADLMVAEDDGCNFSPHLLTAAWQDRLALHK